MIRRIFGARRLRVARLSQVAANRWRRAGSLATCITAATAAIVALSTSPASAAPAAPPFIGELVEAELPGPSFRAEGVAVDEATGDVYVTSGQRVLELSPYGAFVREIGDQVNKTKVSERESEEAAKEAVKVTALEEDTCTAASGNECGSASGAVPGELQAPAGVAVEKSTGAIYVVNSIKAGSVVKLASDGSFDWALGDEVNATKAEEREREEAKSEPITVSKKEEDICTGASGDVCQSGQRGVTGGIFEAALTRGGIAVGGPAGHLYVGNEGRVQVFDSSGTQVEEDSVRALSPSGTVKALAVSSAGDVFVGDEGVAGVHEIEPGGTLSSSVYGAANGSGIAGLAVGGSGDLYVGEDSFHAPVKEYEVGAPSAPPAEFGSGPGLITEGDAVAVDPAGTAYVAQGYEGSLLMFGSLAKMEAAYGLPSAITPTIGSESTSSGSQAGEVTLEAEVNPQLRTTTYQFQYGPQPCSQGGCTSTPASPVTIGSVTKTLHTVTASVQGLQTGHVYYLRVAAANSVGAADALETAFTVGAAPGVGTPGLPDGRHYELVSPANKHGNSVHAGFLGLTTPEGNTMIYEATGGVGSARSSVPGEYIARHSPQGWSTEGAVPPQVGSVSLTGGPDEFIPSRSFSKFLFLAANGSYTTAEPTEPSGSVNIFEWGGGGSEVTWLGQPTIANPSPALGKIPHGYLLAGASPELRHVYFTYFGTLVPEDAPRAPYTGEQRNSETRAWGFYEWEAGHLQSAGVLPNGSESPYGAVAASVAGVLSLEREEYAFSNFLPEQAGNEVSEGGQNAFFVSPDPLASQVTNPTACERSGPCTTEAPQLYVRETTPGGGKRTVLVSRSELPGAQGQPAQHGAEAGIAMGGSYVYASPDGSKAFFLSSDRLTSAAPANNKPKAYEFDLETETLTYLPGVSGNIVTVDPHATDLIFESSATNPYQIDLWTAGPGGGSVRPVAQLPGARTAGAEEVRQARVTADGSVFLFGTTAPVPAGFNNGGGYEQLYRYVVASGELDCVSCPGSGHAPTGNAEASRADWSGANEYDLADAHSTMLPREMSANGERVFFDSPNALTPQATNGQRDVYEWEAGKVYLISSGSSAEASFVMDSSASGNDVFFGTSAGLVSADTDGAYDVYDARVPQPGDNPPPEAAPCEGAVCQGPPSTPRLLRPSASATFSGAGNLLPAPLETTGNAAGKAKKRTAEQKLKRALNACKKSKRGRKKQLARCEAKARRRYGKATTGHRARRKKRQGGKAGRHHHGRGK
ncbi:MAG: NHL repeat-containing protein [Solirubrobacteraceae bacterium]